MINQITLALASCCLLNVMAKNWPVGDGLWTFQNIRFVERWIDSSCGRLIDEKNFNIPHSPHLTWHNILVTNVPVLMAGYLLWPHSDKYLNSFNRKNKSGTRKQLQYLWNMIKNDGTKCCLCKLMGRLVRIWNDCVCQGVWISIYYVTGCMNDWRPVDEHKKW